MSDRIRQIVYELASLYRESFSDLAFLEPGGGPLQVELGGEEFSFVRFELPGKESLHLKSLSLIDSEGNAIESAVATLSSSSHHGDSHALSMKRTLLDGNGNHPWGLHTEDQSNTWVQISFTAPMRAQTLVVHNRSDRYACLASGLRVSVSPNGMDWRVVFDAACRARLFHSEAQALVGTHSMRRVVKIVACVLLSDYTQAMQKFGKLVDKYRPPLTEAVSETVLKKRELTWAAHGITRSFCFWTRQEKTEYIEFALEVVKVLREEFDDVCFGFGSVLAAVREKDLISHDDDMDIIVGLDRAQATSISSGLALVVRHLERRGYGVSGRFFSHRHVTGNGLQVDVFVGIYEEADEIGWYPGRRRALRRDRVFPAGSSNLLGLDCPIPRQPEDYLCAVYGEGWRAPSPGWRHDWNCEPYLDMWRDWRFWDYYLYRAWMSLVAMRRKVGPLWRYSLLVVGWTRT